MAPDAKKENANSIGTWKTRAMHPVDVRYAKPMNSLLPVKDQQERRDQSVRCKTILVINPLLSQRIGVRHAE